MKKRLFYGGMLVYVLGAGTLFAQSDFPDPLTLPPLTQLVTDYSQVLDAATLSGLNAQGLVIEQQTSAQVAAVLFPHRAGNELFDIGMRLFRESGIGQEGKNNGVLLLIATEEKKLRIVVGYGLEGAIPDIAASQLIEQTLRPLVNEGRRADAIAAYYSGVALLLTQEGGSVSVQEDYQPTGRDIGAFLLRFILMVRSFSQIKKKTASKQAKWGPLRLFGALLLFIILTLPGVLGAFFGYIGGLFAGIFFFGPRPPRGGGIWSGGSGRGSGGGMGGFGGGGFGGFGGGSSGGGGAGD